MKDETMSSNKTGTGWINEVAAVVKAVRDTIHCPRTPNMSEEVYCYAQIQEYKRFLNQFTYQTCPENHLACWKIFTEDRNNSGDM